MEFVTLVNRSTKTLRGVWDGRIHELKPGKHSFPEIQAIKFKEQNPVMGSQDPATGYQDFLIGIVELGDNCEPIEQSSAVERWDREKIAGPPVQVVAGKGKFSPVLDAQPGLPLDSSFVRP